MHDQYDFSDAKKGPVISGGGKTRITTMLDDDVIRAFREKSEHTGVGYQTLINQSLREVVFPSEPHLSEERLRRVIREELGSYQPTRESDES